MLSPKTLIATTCEALRLKTGKVFIQQAWTGRTYFIHTGVYKSLFASLALSTKKNPTHNHKTPSFLLHVPRRIYRYTKAHTCIHIHKTQAKDAAKEKMEEMLLSPSNFYDFLMIKMTVSSSFSFYPFVKARSSN